MTAIYVNGVKTSCMAIGGGGSSIVEKRYARFTSLYSVALPDKFALNGYVSSNWNLLPKIVLKIFATEYKENGRYMGNYSSADRSGFFEYNNKFYGSYGSSTRALADWSAGEHTYIENDDDGYITLDGVQNRIYSTQSQSAKRFIGPTNRNELTSALAPDEIEAGRSQVCLGYFMNLKIYNKTNNNELVWDLVPAEFNGMACFYEKVEDKVYFVPELMVTDTTPTIPTT